MLNPSHATNRGRITPAPAVFCVWVTLGYMVELLSLRRSVDGSLTTATVLGWWRADRLMQR